MVRILFAFLSTASFVHAGNFETAEQSFRRAELFSIQNILNRDVTVTATCVLNFEVPGHSQAGDLIGNRPLRLQGSRDPVQGEIAQLTVLGRQYTLRQLANGDLGSTQSEIIVRDGVRGIRSDEQFVRFIRQADGWVLFSKVETEVVSNRGILTHGRYCWGLWR